MGILNTSESPPPFLSERFVNITTHVRQVFQSALEIMRDARNFPVVDPGYAIDLRESRAQARKNAIDPLNMPSRRSLRIPL